MPGTAKMILDVVRQQSHGAEANPLRAEDQHVNQSRNHRRNRERQVNQREQQFLPRKSNLAIAQAAATPKTQFSGTAMPAAMKVSLMAATGQRVVERVKIETDTFGKCLRENRRQRHEQKQTQKHQRHADEQPAHERRFGRHAAGSGAARGGEG